MISEKGESLNEDSLFDEAVLNNRDFNVVGKGIFKDESEITARWLALKTIINDSKNLIGKELENYRKRKKQLEEFETESSEINSKLDEKKSKFGRIKCKCFKWGF